MEHIKYNILWFEDTNSFYNLNSTRITKNYKNSDLHIEYHRSKDDSELKNLTADSNYDLILVDYHLDRKVKGDDVINKIRKLKLLTEIVFYSSDKEFKKDITQTAVEGIYFANKNTLFTKAKAIINKTVRSFDQVAVQRGNFIAEAITLEAIIDDILLSYFTPQKDFKDKILNSEGFSTMHKFKLLKDLINDKLDILKDKTSEKGKSDFAELTRLKTNFNKFQKQIIEVRNILAHVPQNIDEGDKVVFTTKNGEKFAITQDGVKEKRKVMANHSENLKALSKFFLG